MLSIVRVPDARRESVLKAAECGPDIIDLPMAKRWSNWRIWCAMPAGPSATLPGSPGFAPPGARGFFSVSPALRYGMVDSVPGAQQYLNEQLPHLAKSRDMGHPLLAVKASAEETFIVSC
jgi:hypothetical protein